MTWEELITDALFEIGAYSPGDPIEAPVMAIGQRWLNRIIDRWAALKRYAYGQQFNPYQIIPNLQPHTLGPGATVTQTALAAGMATFTALNNFNRNDLVSTAGCTNAGNTFNVTGGVIAFATATYFQVAITHGDVAPAAENNGRASAASSVGANQAPVVPTWITPNGQPAPPQLDGCNLVLDTSNPSTDLIVNVRDAAWWWGNQVKAITSTVPTDVYVQTDFPNMSLYFWPVPTFAYQARLETRQLITRVTDLTTTFVAPLAYEEALVCTLAGSLCGPLSRPMPVELPTKIKIAVAALETNNMGSPRIASADYGAGLGRRAGGFNWRSGLPAGYSGPSR